MSMTLDGIAVWTASLDQVRPEWMRYLDLAERGRISALRQTADRDRFLLASCVVRAVTGAYESIDPAQVVLDRTCADCGRPHGRIRLPGSRLHISVSHSGLWVFV